MIGMHIPKMSPKLELVGGFGGVGGVGGTGGGIGGGGGIEPSLALSVKAFIGILAIFPESNK